MEARPPNKYPNGGLISFVARGSMRPRVRQRHANDHVYYLREATWTMSCTPVRIEDKVDQSKLPASSPGVCIDLLGERNKVRFRMPRFRMPPFAVFNRTVYVVELHRE